MNRIKISLSLLVIFISKTFLSGQTKLSENGDLLPIQIYWQKTISMKNGLGETQKYMSFQGAQYSIEDGSLPRFYKKIVLYVGSDFSAEIRDAKYETATEEEAVEIKNSYKIENQIILKTNVEIIRKQHYGVVSFIPIRKNTSNGKFEKLVSFNLITNPFSTQKSNTRSVHTYGAHSVLANGSWYKIAIASDGIYKITYQFLQNLGINVSTLNPQNIRIYGNGGGMLPEKNSISRLDDLIENAIMVKDINSNGIFDTDDYVLFYGKGPNTWSYNSSSCTKFKHTINLYSDSSYYFITTDLGFGKRISNQVSTTLPPTKIVTSFDDFEFHENESTNFIKSGRLWFGESFETILSYNFSFAFPNIDITSNVNVTTSIASRSLSGAANYVVSAVGQTNSTSLSISAVSGDSYAVLGSGCLSIVPNNSNNIVINITKQSANAIGWLDYIEINARRHLVMTGDQMIFRDAQSMGIANVAKYNIASNDSIQIWDISNPLNAQNQILVNSGNTYQFTLPSDTLKQFIAFTGVTYPTPSPIGKIDNQDLHSLTNKDLIIVTHPDFLVQAKLLASYHESSDSIYSNVVTTEQIYNEFSSGAQDISAIRDFVKMFYDRAGSNSNLLPKYLLLFGDGSYDNKKRINSNTDVIPTYESYESFSSVNSYVSDDFYGCLDDNEGTMIANVDVVDIGVGRFPVNTKSDADAVLNKIRMYKKTGTPLTNTTQNSCLSQPCSPFGDWRNMLCFIADDENTDLHISQAEQMATTIDTVYGNYNIDKIYFDAYPQQTTSQGDRYPDVSAAITKRVEKGCLIMNYTGHGGETGFAHEHVVDISQILSWNNICNMPLIFTATCELSRYDDPQRISAGEYMFLNPNGAGIALLTTVRESYAGPNFTLNQNFYKTVFKPIGNKMPKLGDIYQFIKTQPGGNSINSRNFTLLGDPALTLNYPKDIITTDTINNIAISASTIDTLKALSKVTISGFVRDRNNVILNNYAGILYPTVYDKPQNITTLSNDGTSESPPYTFKLQNNILFKGKISISNGHFNFSFIVPKDISYKYGFGKISYYAENGNEDAAGFYKKAVINGINSNAVTDVNGPDVKLFLNDNKFIFGGLTNEKPDLYSTLKDANGINTVGTGIGHDITAVLDGNTTNSIILNDYYLADLNSYKSGSIRYPLASLTEGRHTLKLKVWDVYDNSSESYTEFIVAKSAELALNHVLNYPNPFTTKTQFFFEENQCCQMLDVQIQIFTVSGKLVKTIDQFVNLEGFRSDPISWDGRDDFGDKIGRGVYIYRIKVKTNEGTSAEKYEKLVILN